MAFGILVGSLPKLFKFFSIFFSGDWKTSHQLSCTMAPWATTVIVRSLARVLQKSLPDDRTPTSPPNSISKSPIEPNFFGKINCTSESNTSREDGWISVVPV